MRNINAQVLADIKAGWVSTVCQIVRTDGVTQTFTDHDSPLNVAGLIFIPAAGLSGIRLTLTNNATVSDVQIRAAWLPVLQESDILSGVYDNATVSFGYISWKNPQLGAVWIFSGLTSTVKATQDGFQASAQSSMWTLQRQLGVYTTANCRHVLGSTTDPQGVGGCLLNLTPYTYTGTITNLINPMVWQVSIPGWNNAATPSTPNAPTLSSTGNVTGQYVGPGQYYYSVSSINAQGQESSTSPISGILIQPNNPPVGGSEINIGWNSVPGAVSYNVYGNTSQQLLINTTATSIVDNGSYSNGGSPPLFGDYFALGILTMTSGHANGMQTDVKTMRGQTLWTLLPMGRPVAVGDTFSVTAGCPKIAAACQYKFNNIVNFGGFPDLSPERQWQ